MIQKKICLLGPFATGKTSLIKRFVDSIFSDKYLTTIGVKIDKKSLSIANKDVNLIIWDIEGEDDHSQIKGNYLRGASGYIIVADGTRPDTLTSALSIHQSTQTILTRAPAILALNKADLEDQWLIPPEALDKVDDDLTLMKTSAKSGENVDHLFTTLSQKMLNIKE